MISSESVRACNSVQAWEAVIDPLYPARQNNSLNLENCSLTDEQGTALFDYLDKHPIKFNVIDLTKNNLTDITAKKIAEVMVKSPSFCNNWWIGNKIIIKDNPITSEGVKACFEAIRKTYREPDFIDFNQEGDELKAEYLRMKRNQDPIIRFFTWVNSFNPWS